MAGASQPGAPFGCGGSNGGAGCGDAVSGSDEDDGGGVDDGLSMETWLDTLRALMAKNLTARLQKNSNEAPLFGQLGGAIVEQRDNSVRVYARVTGSPNGSASPQGAPGKEPAQSPAPGSVR
jgi:hypothetical protein